MIVEQLKPFDFGKDISERTLREKIDLLEGMMLGMPEHQIEITPKHYFSNGLYAREIFIPKGTTLTGKIHLTEHINVISKGDISVMTEKGIERIKAPFTLISLPGTKRVGFAHEDTVWTTFHATTETDLEKLEALLIAPSHEQYELNCKKGDKLCHG